MSRSVWKHNASGRTERRQKSRKRRSFVMLERYMIMSTAWRSLSGEAIAAFVELSNRYNGTNNGSLHLSTRELALIRNCSQRTAAGAMSELVRKGFVEVVKPSGFNVKDRRRQPLRRDQSTPVEGLHALATGGKNISRSKNVRTTEQLIRAATAWPS